MEIDIRGGGEWALGVIGEIGDMWETKCFDGVL
jgi:hypothetical protein